MYLFSTIYIYIYVYNFLYVYIYIYSFPNDLHLYLYTFIDSLLHWFIGDALIMFWCAVSMICYDLYLSTTSCSALGYIFRSELYRFSLISCVMPAAPPARRRRRSRHLARRTHCSTLNSNESARQNSADCYDDRNPNI